MKHRYEHDLARLAFGDVTGAEAEAIRRRLDADPSAAKVYASYRDIAGGLKTMPVPDHQLSSERLRDVLLNQNLKPRSEAPFWKWLWAPVAVGASAYLLVSMINATPNVGPSALVDSGPSILSKGDSDLKAGDEFAIRDPHASQHVAPGGSVSGNAPDGSGSGSNSAARSDSRSKLRSGKATLVGGAQSGKPEVRIAPSPSSRGGFVREASAPPGEAIVNDVENAIAMNALSMESPPAGPAPIVIIGTEKDSNTGANRATEVSTVNNVVIGG